MSGVETRFMGMLFAHESLTPLYGQELRTICPPQPTDDFQPGIRSGLIAIAQTLQRDAGRFGDLEMGIFL